MKRNLSLLRAIDQSVFDGTHDLPFACGKFLDAMSRDADSISRLSPTTVIVSDLTH
jgi:hypothetical protein